MESTIASLQLLALSLAPMLGAIDYYLVLVALGAAAWLYEWFRKKTAGGQRGSPTEDQSGVPPAAPPQPGAPPPAASSWEEELRRLLSEGPTTSPAPPPAPRPAPPPVPPVVVSRPKPVSVPQPVVQQGKPKATPVRPPPLAIEQPEEAPRTLLAKFEQSRAALQKASQLHASVGAHLRKIDEQTEHHGVAAARTQGKTVSPEVAAVVALLRKPRTARQVVVASVILSPPNSL